MAKKIEKNKETSEEKEEIGGINEEEIPEEKIEVHFEEEERGGLEEKKAKKREKDVEAILNIYTSFNNTIAHVTDSSGRTIAKVSGGMVTKHSRLKANPTIAMFIAKRIAETMKDRGIKSLYVKIRAKTGNTSPGSGANAIIKSLSRDGFKILNILDNTRMPRGGPKKKGGRRGRRV